MADIIFIQTGDIDDLEEAMEPEDDDEVNDSNEKSRPEVWDGAGGGGDEGGGDEQLFQITRLQRHATSETSFNRQMVGRILVEVLRSAINNKMTLVMEEIIENVRYVVYDHDTLVRLDLMEQIPNALSICHETPQLFGTIFDYLIGIIIMYLNDEENQVRQMAQSALMTILKRGILDSNIIEQEICPKIEHYFYTFTDEHVRYANISFICRLAPLIGNKIVEKLFLKRYLELCEDNDMMVRKTCATHFGDMCIGMEKEVLLCKLIPAYIDLCGDKVWSIRKACVEVMIPVSCSLILEHRRMLLANILAKRLRDDSKWVRISAFQILGPFISTFAKQFTEVTYNKYGELVYTGKQDDNHLSIRYLYETIFPTRATKSQITDMDDNAKSLFYHLPVVNVKHDNVKVSDSSESCQKTDDNEMLLHVKVKRKRNPVCCDVEEDIDDVEKYNQFLYYYIAPEIPLDDELTYAARQSAMNRNNAQKAVETKNESTVDLKDASSVNLSDEKDSSMDKQQSNIENLSNQKEGKDNDNNDNDNNRYRKRITQEDVLNLVDDIYSHIVKTYNEKKLGIRTADKSDVESCNSFNSFNSSDSDIKNYEQDIVPQELINYYVSMADPVQWLDTGEMAHHCAFSFPAVTLTLGRENWSCLKNAYQLLASAQHWKVRHMLASSIHEIATILGEELTASDLIPIYDGFIKDLDEVRIGVLKHLAMFLKLLKPVHRCQYLPRLGDFLATDNEWNWRFREELAVQLLEIVVLFSPSDVAQSIAPLSLQLLIDKIAAVRNIALKLITQIMHHLSSEDALVMSLIHELRETLVLNSTKWIHRQTYALVCAHLIRHEAIAAKKFSKEMLPSLISLSCDRVPNVRLAVARTLAMDVSAMDLDKLGMEAMEEVERILKRMRVDADRDVRMLAGGEEQINILAYSSEENQVEQPRNILF